MARPPRDKGAGGAVTGAEGLHLGLRFGPARAKELRRLVEHANETARSVGLPQTVTASSLVSMWILAKVDEEIAKLEAQERRRK